MTNSNDRNQRQSEESTESQSRAQGIRPREQGDSDYTARKKGINPRKQRPNNYNRNPSRFTSGRPDSQTDSPLSTKANLDYTSGTLAYVEAVTGEWPNEPYNKMEHEMSISNLFNYFAETVYRYAEVRTTRPTPLFTEDEVKQTFRYLLAMRVAQVSKLPMPERPAEVRYPSVLGPLLASIGRYLHPTAAYEIVPVLNPENPVWEPFIRHWTNQETGKTGWTLQKPEFVDRVVSTLRAYGMPDNIGLPVDTIIDKDDLYRLDDNHELILEQLENGERVSAPQLLGSGDFAPSATTILTRAFLEMTTLSQIYGQHRVVYNSISTLYSAVDKLASDAFSMEVGGNTRK